MITQFILCMCSPKEFVKSSSISTFLRCTLPTAINIGGIVYNCHDNNIIGKMTKHRRCNAI